MTKSERRCDNAQIETINEGNPVPCTPRENKETLLFINKFSGGSFQTTQRPDRKTIGSYVQRNIHRSKRKRASLGHTLSTRIDFPFQFSKRETRQEGSASEAADSYHNPERSTDSNLARKQQQNAASNARISRLMMLRGNSDPFSAAAITITPAAHQLLQLSYHWQLFLDYPVWASALFNDVTFTHHQNYIRKVLHDPATLHCLLASGYYISTQLASGYKHALEHKTLALQLLQKQLFRSRQADVSRVVYQLLALELFCGDYDAAFHHLIALRFILCNDQCGALATMLPHLWISDVWLAYHLHRPTVIEIDTWDTPFVARKFELQYLDPRQYNNSYSHELWKESVVDRRLVEIIAAIHRAIALKWLAIELREPQSQNHLIQWLHLRTASLDGRLLNHLNEQVDLSIIRNGIMSSLTFSKALNAAIVLAAMCYLHLDYTTAKYGGGKLMIHALFEPVLRHVVQLVSVGDISVNIDLMLWLLFMCAVNCTLFPTTHSLQWSLDELATLQASSGHDDWNKLSEVLRKFLYHEKMEELLASPGVNRIAFHPQKEVVVLIGNKFWSSI